MKRIAQNLRRGFGQAVIVTALSLISYAAFAESGIDQGESYSNTTLRDLVQTSILMDAYDLKTPATINDYAKLLYCDLYQQKYTNDFEWNNIRQDLLARITNKKEYYRVLYQFAGPVYLGRYNFDTQDFPFENKTALVNVGVMEMLAAPNTSDSKSLPSKCFADKSLMSFPSSYKIRLAETLTIDRLKMPTGTAQQLLDKILSQNNNDRKVYLRYRVKLLTALPNDPKAKGSGVFTGQLTAADVFLDDGLTQFVGSIALNKE